MSGSRTTQKLDIVRTLRSIIRDPDCPEHMRKLDGALRHEEWSTMRDLDMQNWTGAAKAVFRLSVGELVLTIASLIFSERTMFLQMAIVASWAVLAGLVVWTVRAGRQYKRRWTNVPSGDPPLDSIERKAGPR